VGNNSNAQAVEEGNIVIDAYYGFPNVYKTVFKSAYEASDIDGNLTVSGMGPLGLRGEYLFTDKIGVGLDLGFNNMKITDPYTVTTYDANFNPIVQTYEATYSTKKIGVLATFNYHFLDNDNFDLYGVFGMGYGNRTFSATSTEPGFISSVTVKSPIPIASKIALGMRYFFTDNIGANLSLGFGQGGIVNAGISARF